MIIYIEYVILNNIIVDYILIYLYSCVMGVKCSKKRVFFTICIALCISMVFPFIIKYSMLLALFKVVSLGIIILPLKRYKNVRDYLITYTIFLLHTFLIGGVIWGLINLLNIRYTISGILIADFEFPAGVFLVVVGVTLYILISLIKYILSRKKIDHSFYKVMLTQDNYNFALTGYMDSGNFSTIQNKGIIYLSKSVFTKIENIKSNDKTTTTISSINGVDVIDIIYIDKVSIDDNIYSHIPCGVSRVEFKNFDCLLHSDYIS